MSNTDLSEGEIRSFFNSIKEEKKTFLSSEQKRIPSETIGNGILSTSDILVHEKIGDKIVGIVGTRKRYFKRTPFSVF